MKNRFKLVRRLFLVGVVCSITLVSCKSKAALVGSTKELASIVKDENTLTPEKITKNHYSNKNDFSTLYIRSSAKYRDENNSQTVSAEIKIKRDEKILVSVRVIGITVAKALITPNEVQYYEKVSGTYFEGNYEALSQWLGTDLDYAKIQNMLIGQPIDDMTKDTYSFVLLDKLFKLNATEDKTEKSFYFDSERFLLRKQEIMQPEKERSFEVSYPNFQDFASAILPESLIINATQKKGKTNIILEYKSITFNEDLSFPYSVPDEYDRIFIK